MAIPTVSGIGGGQPGGFPSAPKGVGESEGKSFGEALKESIAQVNQLQKSAETQAQELAMGKSKDVAQTLIAIEKANISFQLMMQVRNKLVEAYQEIMRMQM